MVSSISKLRQESLELPTGKTREEYFHYLHGYVKDRIRLELEVKGMRQVDLAERVGVTEKWISRLETRGDNISLINA